MNKQKLDECEHTCQMLHVSTLALGTTVVPLLKTGDCPLLTAYGQPPDCFACIIYLCQREQIGSFVTTVFTNGAIGVQRVQ